MFAQGQTSTLTWSTTNALTVSIQPIGTVAAAGTQIVSPALPTTYTLTATGTGGTAQSTATVTPLQPLISDNFARPDQMGLGDAPQGQRWRITGIGYKTVAIQDHHYVDGAPVDQGNVSYAGIQIGQQPFRIGGKFSFLPNGAGGRSIPVVALISSKDPSIQLQQMVHLISSRSSVQLSWWSGKSQDNLPASCTGSRYFSAPLKNDGTSYPLYMDIQGDTVTVEKPDGTQYVCTDSHFSQLAGSLGIWELFYGSQFSDVPRWDTAEAYALAE